MSDLGFLFVYFLVAIGVLVRFFHITYTEQYIHCHQGLVVPVLRNAENMNFAEVEKEINNLAKKATDGTISIDEMAGGTFTISNGGVYGSLLSTPIINPPQVCASMAFNLLVIIPMYMHIFHFVIDWLKL